MMTTSTKTSYFLNSRIAPLHHHHHHHDENKVTMSKRMIQNKTLLRDVEDSYSSSSSLSSSSSSSMEDLVKSTTPNSVTMYPSSSSSTSSSAATKNHQHLQQQGSSSSSSASPTATPMVLTTPTRTVSKSIKICSTSLQRTASELQRLQDDEAVADYRDYCFYARLCKGIQDEHSTCPNSAETLRNLMKTRSTSTSLLSSFVLPPPLPSIHPPPPTTTTTTTTNSTAKLNYLQTAHDIVSNNDDTNDNDYSYYCDLENDEALDYTMDYSDTIMDYNTMNANDDDDDDLEDDGVFDMDL